MHVKELVKRYLLFIISLFFSAMGVALTKHAELGVSPISSVANIMSCQFTALSLGYWLILWNCTLILVQILLLRRDFKIYQLLQIPLSFLFGYFTDFGMWCVSHIPVPSYPIRILLVISGVVVLSLGIALSVIANVIMNSGEAVVKAISDKTGKNFGNIKIGFDVSCVVIAVLLSLIFFHGSLVGSREGTLITALLTGIIVKFFTKHLSGGLEQLMTGKVACR